MKELINFIYWSVLSFENSVRIDGFENICIWTSLLYGFMLKIHQFSLSLQEVIVRVKTEYELFLLSFVLFLVE